MEKYHMPYVVVFIPAYNEGEAIKKVINALKQRYVGNETQDYIVEIIVVDDGSRDNTAQSAREAGVKKIVVHPYNRGLGAATRTGMQTAYEMGADIAVKIDADGQNEIEGVEKVVRPILEDRADSVFGSRLMGGLEYKMPLYRDWGNRFFAWFVSQIVGMKISDATTGLMAFHRRYLEVFNIIKDYNETQQLIIDSWGKHMRIMEVSVIFHKRLSGRSFIKKGFKYPSIVIPTMLRMYIHFKPLRFFLEIGLLFIILGVLAVFWITVFGQTFFGDAAITILILLGFQIIFFGLLADQISFKRK